MSWRWFCSFLFIGILFEVEFTHSAPAEVGKTKEKVRPYEFGFSIEEQQHRHEKRDENGIVMGEFGFITADGIYHVTVYATDENGKFKIISMKSYPYGKMEKKVMIARLPAATKKPAVTTKAPTTIKAMKPDGSSCGGCVLPKKSKSLPADVKDTKPQDEKAVFRPLSKDLNDDNTGGKVASTKLAPKPMGTSPLAGTAKGKGSSSSIAQKPGSQPLVPPKVTAPGTLKPNFKGISSPKTGTGASGNKESGNNIPQIDKRFGDDDEVPSKPGSKTSTTNPQSTNKQTSPKAPSTQSTGKTANTAGGVGVGAVSKGSSGSANGVGGGGGPLYRFNYVLDYNSHREEGSVDGSKEGNYNTIDEDGIRRIIDYIANENGYQPHIKLQRLPPNEVPTGENKLKKYEFVWFNKN